MKNKGIGTIILFGSYYSVLDSNCGLIQIEQEEAKQFKNNDNITYELEEFWHKNDEGKTIGWSKFASQPKLKGETNETL
jgi:hypothetical protein